MQKQIIESKLFEYLELKNIKITKKGPILFMDCPFCKAEKLAIRIPNTYKFNCHQCKKRFDIFDLAELLETKVETEEERIHQLKTILNLDIVTKIEEKNLDTLLKFYNDNNFDLVPIARGQKIPIETNWTKKEHKDIEEWKRWLVDGLNIGVKTGAISNITILDIDQKPIPQEIKDIMGETLIQESTNGYHLFYKYESDLPKTRIDKYKIDLENDGGQVVIAPSKIKEVARKIKMQEIIKMPENLKALIKQHVTVPLKTESEELREDIQEEDFNLKLLGTGERNSSLIRLGGIFRKELNERQTEYVLNALNRHICEQPLPRKEISAMSRKLAHYTSFDERELAHQIVDYLKSVEEASRNEIALAVVGTNRGEDKKRVDKALSYLIKEEILVKKTRAYSIVNSLDWTEDLLDIGTPINIKVPYFHDWANLNFDDLIIIGSQNKYGKTTLAMNFVKRLVEQGIKPDYIYNESGGRFAKTALKLGMKSGDFSSAFVASPTDVLLRKDKITIFDWVKPDDFARTDNVFSSLVEKVKKNKGFLICFVQLRTDDTFFAKDQIGQFPALLTRYVYEDESGENTKFIIDAARDPKIKGKKWELPCKYIWETKEVKTVDELQQNEENKINIKKDFDTIQIYVDETESNSSELIDETGQTNSNEEEF